MVVTKVIKAVIPRDEDTEFLAHNLHHRVVGIFCRGWYWEFALEADEDY